MLQREGSRLPVELIDQIVALASGDPATLRACARVCRTWNAVARTHIFCRVRVRTGEQLRDLEDVLRTTPAIGPRVREVKFGPCTPKSYRESTPWLASIPRVLPGMLPALRTLRFERVTDAAEYCDARFFKGLQGFASVTTLVIEDSGLNIPALRAFACALPNLDALVVRDLLPLMVNLWSPPPLLHRPRFTTLSVSFAVQPSTTMSDFLDWFARSDARRTVRSLHLSATILDTKAVNTTLARVGPGLAHLSLKLQSLFKSEWEYERIQREIDIAPCAKLASLALEPTCPAIAGFLAKLAAPGLRTLAFRLAAGDAPADLAWLAALLEARRFGELAAVRFVHERARPEAALRAGLEEAFAGLHKKGVLQVVEDEEA